MQIHDRDSHREVIETLLADGSPERTVFHSYSGGAEMGEIARDNGWYLSFSGTVSYKATTVSANQPGWSDWATSWSRRTRRILRRCRTAGAPTRRT